MHSTPQQIGFTLTFLRSKFKNESADNKTSNLKAILDHPHSKLLTKETINTWQNFLADALESPDLQIFEYPDESSHPLLSHFYTLSSSAMEQALKKNQEWLFDFAVDIQVKFLKQKKKKIFQFKFSFFFFFFKIVENFLI